MMSILPQCSKLFLKMVSTVERIRTSQRRGRKGARSEDGFTEDEFVELGQSECTLASVSVKLCPTAVTRSEWARAALTTERPMWPVAPKT